MHKSLKRRKALTGKLNPELLPYLQEADRKEQIELPVSDISTAEPDLTRLREVLAAGGIEIPDAIESFIDEDEESGTQTAPNDTFAVDSEESGRVASAPSSSSKSDETLRTDFQVAEVYSQILTRRPEHNISPTKARIERALDYLANPQLPIPACILPVLTGKPLPRG